MQLNPLQQEMLDGKQGRATRKAMEILTTLGTIYGAEYMLPVRSVQIAGVSYDNLGDAGLQFLSEMAEGGGQARVLATLNPAGVDVENGERMGIDAEFTHQQQRVIDAFTRMGIIPTCSCTPYLTGNVPLYGEHVAWAESSAVCYANSVLGARTNREGGPSALAAALTGFTPAYGLHLDENRCPTITIQLQTRLSDTVEFGALGKVIGDRLETRGKERLPYITGMVLSGAVTSLENLKSFCASIATYGGVAMFHMEGVTPEAASERSPAVAAPPETLVVTRSDLDAALREMSDAAVDEVDFVSLGCPHLSIAEIARLAHLLEGKKVTKTFWITTARPTKQIADLAGYTKIIEDSGAVFAVDTCGVVAPIRGRFRALATDSAKACYYASSKNKFKTLIRSFEEVVEEAVR